MCWVSSCVPGLIIVSMYLLCTEQPHNALLLLFTDSLYGGQPALKLWVRHLPFYSFWRKGLLNGFAASSYSYGSANAHLEAPFSARHHLLKQRQVFDSGNLQWDKQYHTAGCSRNMTAGFSLSLMTRWKKKKEKQVKIVHERAKGAYLTNMCTLSNVLASYCCSIRDLCYTTIVQTC